MALSLKDPETDRLAREVARLTGESLTQAVRTALSERLDRERLRRAQPRKSLG
jgi:antitoxin VapB